MKNNTVAAGSAGRGNMPPPPSYDEVSKQPPPTFGASAPPAYGVPPSNYGVQASNYGVPNTNYGVPPPSSIPNYSYNPTVIPTSATAGTHSVTYSNQTQRQQVRVIQTAVVSQSRQVHKFKLHLIRIIQCYFYD